MPAPAVLALLEGYPMRGIDIKGETATPTGAALVTTLASQFGSPPSMNLERAGHGAGNKDFLMPDIVRVLVEKAARGIDTLTLLETNIDDMNPEWLGPLLDDLLAEGVLDAWFTPIHMKKNRPAVQLSMLCESDQVAALRAFIFAQTSILGIRQITIERHSLPRRIETVETVYGQVRIKLAEYAPEKWKAVPEVEDCRVAVQAHGVSLAEVYAATLAAWRNDRP